MELSNRRHEKWHPETSNVNFAGTLKTEGEGSVTELARFIAFTLEKGVREKDGQ